MTYRQQGRQLTISISPSAVKCIGEVPKENTACAWDGRGRDSAVGMLAASPPANRHAFGFVEPCITLRLW